MARLAAAVRALVRRTAGRMATRARPGTCLIVPVLDAEPAVAAWLGRGSVASDGAPLHVTVMWPFLPAHAVDQAAETAIAALAGEIEPFDFELPRLGRFPGVLYLAPEPAPRFVAITDAIQRRWPSCQPYGGKYDAVRPHVTVALGDQPPADPAALERVLPVASRAEEIWLLEQTPRGWRTRRRFPLGQPCPPK
jgi:2'-5' RNA ligase superfamily